MLSAKGSEVRPEEAQLGVPGMASGRASEDSQGQAVAGSVGEEQGDPGSSRQSGRVWDMGMGPGGRDSREEKGGFTRLWLANWGCGLTWGFSLDRLVPLEDLKSFQLLCLNDSQDVVECGDTRNFSLWRMLF